MLRPTAPQPLVPTPGRAPVRLSVLVLLALGAGGCGPLTPSRPADPIDALERQATEGAARAKESAVALEYTAADAPTGARRVASGVVISEEGDVLSVRIDRPTPGSLPIMARVASGRRLPAAWVAADPRTGLTLLKIAPGEARPAEPADREPLPGLPLLLVGNPFGLGHSVSRGYVAGTGRRLLYGAYPLGGLIQVDTGLHPGDSGALVADLRGRWLGLIRSGLAPPTAVNGSGSGSGTGREREADRDDLRSGQESGHGHDLGFAVPARDALWVARQLRVHGRVDRAFLGVVTNPLTAPPEAGAPGQTPVGVELTDVVAGSPAARAGLKPGDRIVALSGDRVSSPVDLTDFLDRTAAGDAVTVEFLRGPGPDADLLRETLLTGHRPRTLTPRPVVADAVAEPVAPAAPAVDLADQVARLERRLRDLEREATKRDAEAGVARKP